MKITPEWRTRLEVTALINTLQRQISCLCSQWWYNNDNEVTMILLKGCTQCDDDLHHLLWSTPPLFCIVIPVSLVACCVCSQFAVCLVPLMKRGRSSTQNQSLFFLREPCERILSSAKKKSREKGKQKGTSQAEATKSSRKALRKLLCICCLLVPSSPFLANNAPSTVAFSLWTLIFSLLFEPQAPLCQHSLEASV